MTQFHLPNGLQNNWVSKNCQKEDQIAAYFWREAIPWCKTTRVPIPVPHYPWPGKYGEPTTIFPGMLEAALHMLCICSPLSISQCTHLYLSTQVYVSMRKSGNAHIGEMNTQKKYVYQDFTHAEMACESRNVHKQKTHVHICRTESTCRHNIWTEQENTSTHTILQTAINISASYGYCRKGGMVSLLWYAYTEIWISILG